MGSVELAFTAWGEAKSPAVLLVHGVAGCGRVWEPLAQGLANRYHVLAPDLRGHGASPRPGEYAPKDYFADIEAFVAARQLPSLALVGHSFGGLLCAGFAARHPEQVRALVSIDINIPPPDRQIEHLRAAGNEPHPIFATRAAAVDYLRKTIAPAARDEIVQALADALLTPDANGLTLNFDRETLRQAEPLDVAGELGRIGCPTLFLRGSESPVMDRAGAIAMLHQVDRSRLVQIPRAGHHVFLDNPTAALQEIRLFLTEALSPDSPTRKA